MSTEPIITRPGADEYPEWVKGYIATVPTDDPLAILKSSHEDTRSQLLKLSEEQLNYRYQPGKWTIKEILGHIIDTERIMSYRALRFARHDTTELPGFDQDPYVEHAKAPQRTLPDLLREYSAVRQATIELFRSFDEETLQQVGIANQRRLSVRSLAYTIAGHELHHWNIIRERYLRVSE